MSPQSRIKYADISARQLHCSWASYCIKKVSIFFVYALQGLPLTPNAFTAVSFLLALAAAASLIGWNLKSVSIILLLLSFMFDQVDGIWARLKNQTSDFGMFLDPYLDKAKDLLLDMSFFLYYLPLIEIHLHDRLSVLAAVASYFIVKSLYYMVRDSEPPAPRIVSDKKGLRLTAYGGAEKHVFVYPLIILSFSFFAFYAIVHFMIYFANIFMILRKKYLRMEGRVGLL